MVKCTWGSEQREVPGLTLQRQRVYDLDTLKNPLKFLTKNEKNKNNSGHNFERNENIWLFLMPIVIKKSVSTGHTCNTKIW